MSRAWIALVVALTACGRWQFDELVRDGAASGDGRVGDSGPLVDGPGLDCHVNHASAILCDGFEDGMTPWPYSVIFDATVDATTTRAWGGSHALEVHTDNSTNYKDGRWGAYLPAAITTGDLYVRQYMWLPSSVAITGQISLVVIGNGTSPYPATFFYLDGAQLVINTDGNPVYGVDTLPRDRWVCAEMQIQISATNGFVKVTFDGIPALQTPAIDTDVAGGYTNIDVGVHYATDTQGPASLWIDDIVVDTNPIGCN